MHGVVSVLLLLQVLVLQLWCLLFITMINSVRQQYLVISKIERASIVSRYYFIMTKMLVRIKVALPPAAVQVAGRPPTLYIPPPTLGSAPPRRPGRGPDAAASLKRHPMSPVAQTSGCAVPSRSTARPPAQPNVWVMCVCMTLGVCA